MKLNSYEQYWWIMDHPQFNKGGISSVRIEITPHLVCPETKQIEPYMHLNTQMEFWVELCCDLYSDHDKKFTSHHLWEMDCGGSSWDEAVDKLYTNVLEKYGDYEREDFSKEYENQVPWSGESAFLEGKADAPIQNGEWDDVFAEDNFKREIKNAQKLIEVLTKRAENKYADKEKFKERVLYCNRVIKRGQMALRDKVYYE